MVWLNLCCIWNVVTMVVQLIHFAKTMYSVCMNAISKICCWKATLYYSLFLKPRGQGQFSGRLYSWCLLRHDIWKASHPTLTYGKVEEGVWHSQPPVSSTAAAEEALPHCCSWWPTVPCCLGVAAHSHTQPPSSGSEILMYYYLRFLIQRCPVCIRDKYLDNIILVHIYTSTQEMHSKIFNLW